MTQEVHLYVDEDGSVTFVHDDRVAEALGDLGKATTTRVSHVEPDHLGGWAADMRPLGGPVLGSYRTRQEALAAELEWVAQYLDGGEPVRLRPTLYRLASRARRRFWEKVDRTQAPCWHWCGARRGSLGYGAITLGSRRDGTRVVEATHRVAWMLTYGPLHPSAKVLHECDNPLCVRPDHLFLGTDGDNVRDCVAKGRHRSGTTKLSDHDKECIRTLSESRTTAELSKMFDVDETTIRRARRR